MDGSLLARLGGPDALNDIIDVFYKLVIEDERLSFMFAGIDFDKLKAHQVFWPPCPVFCCGVPGSCGLVQPLCMPSSHHYSFQLYCQQVTCVQPTSSILATSTTMYHFYLDNQARFLRQIFSSFTNDALTAQMHKAHARLIRDYGLNRDHFGAYCECVGTRFVGACMHVRMHACCQYVSGLRVWTAGMLQT